ncbi:MAG: 2-oxo acid dehydrogenase subunit E2 [Candidatus Margulisbacteria bacterium]|nr:2-oxo acid dehydrogenase subunit E2 [Candidatus Margulisiibacteriota bacterium]
MQNIKTGERMSRVSYRKISIASWSHPKDPSIYCQLELETTNALKFINEINNKRNKNDVTLTHLVVKILGECFYKYNVLNLVLIRNKLFLRKETNVFVSTLLRTKKGKDLSGFSVKNVPDLTIEQVSEIVSKEVDFLRKSKESELEGFQSIVRWIPSMLLGIVYKIIDFVIYTLNLSPRIFGLPSDPIGSVIVTNLGSLGLENAFVPLSPYTRCPLIVAIGKTKMKPVVDNGQVVAKEITSLNFTLDHRYADGADAGLFLHYFKKIFENPESYSSVFK